MLHAMQCIPPPPLGFPPLHTSGPLPGICAVPHAPHGPPPFPPSPSQAFHTCVYSCSLGLSLEVSSLSPRM